MTQPCRASFWLIVVCGSTGSGAPWQPRDNGGHHEWWVRGLASLPMNIACQVSAGPQKSCQPSCLNSYRKNLYWNVLCITFWQAQSVEQLAITSPKRHLRSNPRLANNHKYHLEHFGHLNHAHLTKIDLQPWNLPFWQLLVPSIKYIYVTTVSYCTYS